MDLKEKLAIATNWQQEDPQKFMLLLACLCTRLNITPQQALRGLHDLQNWTPEEQTN